MGNSSSSSSRNHQDETVDYGALVPQGVYTGPQDWNHSVVSQLIVSRKLAPFYRPLEDFNESWDDDKILAARKEFQDSDHVESLAQIDSISSSRSKRPASLKEPARPEAQIYRGAVECPICFLYYPPNINRSRCCDQAICTECFVQIKRSEPTTTHIVSEPASCPYCVQENFGVVYTPPFRRQGLGSEHGGLSSDTSRSRSPTEPISPPAHKRRQKSFGADSPGVVLIDHIRPDWEAKLEAVRAAVARRANRRIIMRQVGDRLIPIGVTSGRVHTLTPEEVVTAAATVESGSRRSRRRGAGGNHLEQLVGMTGPDLEELMLMEAMRLSMLDHEERQRKEAEEKKKGEPTASVPIHSGEGSSSSRAAGPGIDTQIPLPASSSSSLSISSQRGRNSPAGRTSNKSRSISRSRTPSPAIPALFTENNQSTRRGPADAPPPFSTLSAALIASSTATSVLSVPSPNDVTTSRATENASTNPTIPIITINAERSPMNHPTGAEHGSVLSDTPLPPLPVEAVPSTLSSTDDPSTSGSTSASSSFGSNTHVGMESPPRSSLDPDDVSGLGKPVSLQTSALQHVDEVSR